MFEVLIFILGMATGYGVAFLPKPYPKREPYSKYRNKDGLLTRRTVSGRE